MDFKTFFLEVGFIGLFLVQYGHSKDFDLESSPATWEDAKKVCGGSGNMMVPGRRYRAKALVRSLTEGQEVWLNGWRAASGSTADAEGKLSTVKVDFSRSVSKAIKVVCRLESVMYDPYFEADTIDTAQAICKRDGAVLADINTEEDITALSTRLVEDTPHWINSMSYTASPIKQCLMAKRVDNDVVYNYDDCERQLQFICLKDDGLIESFSPLISLKKARYEEFQQTIEQHLSSLASVSMAESSTAVPEISVSDSVPSATSISPSESSSFTPPAVEDAQTESIKPSSLTFSDSQSSSETEQFTPVLAETKSVSTDETELAESSSVPDSVNTESESIEPSSSSVPEVIASAGDDDYATDLIDMRTGNIEVSSTPSSQIPVVTTTTDTDFYDYKFTEHYIVDSMSDYDFPDSTSESDTQHSISELDSSTPSYDTISSTPVYGTESGMPHYETDDDGSDLPGGLETSFTSEYRQQTSPSFAQKTSVVPMFSEGDLTEPSSNMYSEIFPSKSVILIDSTSIQPKDKDMIKMTGSEQTYISSSLSTDDFDVTEAQYDYLDIPDTNADIYKKHFYDIPTKSYSYSKIAPSKSIVLMESSVFPTKVKDMSEVSGTEKTYISSSPSEYDVTDSPYDDYEDYSENSKFIEIPDTYKEQFYDIPTSSDSYSEIMPSKSVVVMESSIFPTKDADMSKESGTKTTHISSSPSFNDVKYSPYDDYDSDDYDDSDTYHDNYKDTFDKIPTTPPVIVVEGVTVETGDDSRQTTTKVDTNIDGDVSKEDDDDDDNRLGNQSADKTLGAKAKEPEEETEVGLWVAFSILILLVIVAVILAVFLWRRRQKQKSKDITKPNGAAPPPGETVELRDSRSPSRENGATRETATFKDPAYDI